MKSDHCRERPGAVGVLRGDVHCDVMWRASLNRHGSFAEALVEAPFAIRQVRGAGQSRAVFAIRSFSVVRDVETGDHRDAMLTANTDDALHQGADFLVVDIFFVHGDSPWVISRLALYLEGQPVKPSAAALYWSRLRGTLLVVDSDRGPSRRITDLGALPCTPGAVATPLDC